MKHKLLHEHRLIFQDYCERESERRPEQTPNTPASPGEQAAEYINQGAEFLDEMVGQFPEAEVYGAANQLLNIVTPDVADTEENSPPPPPPPPPRDAPSISTAASITPRTPDVEELQIDDLPLPPADDATPPPPPPPPRDAPSISTAASITPNTPDVERETLRVETQEQKDQREFQIAMEEQLAIVATEEASREYEKLDDTAQAMKNGGQEKSRLIDGIMRKIGNMIDLYDHPIEAIGIINSVGVVGLARVEHYIQERQATVEDLGIARRNALDRAAGAQGMADEAGVFRQYIYDMGGTYETDTENALRFRREEEQLASVQREVERLEDSSLDVTEKQKKLRSLQRKRKRITNTSFSGAMQRLQEEGRDLENFRDSIPSNRDIVVTSCGLLPGGDWVAGRVWDKVQLARGEITTEEMLANLSMETALLAAGGIAARGFRAGATVAARSIQNRMVRRAIVKVAQHGTPAVSAMAEMATEKLGDAILDS